MEVTCKLGGKGCWNDGKCRATSNCENKIVTNADRLPELVFCKSCTHSDTISCSDGMVWCGRMCRYMKEDGFCSFGERKEN